MSKEEQAIFFNSTLSGKSVEKGQDDQTVGLVQGNDKGKGDVIEDGDPWAL